MIRALRAAALLLPALWLTGCEDIDFGDHWDRYKEDFHYSYDLAPGGRLSVENLNGSIEIASWEKNTVDISGTKHAGTQEALKSTRIDISNSPNSISVRTIGPSSWRGVGARYVIRVPKRIELDRIVSSNGSVRIEDVEGTARIKTSNGAIRTARTKGELEANSSNGAMEIFHNGNVRLHTSNGSIRAEVEQGGFDAGTSNGAVIAKLTNPPGDSVRVESTNGHIELTTDRATGIRAHTSNSTITVRMPASVNARLKANTSNSSITSDFDLLVRGGERSKNHLEGTIGGGGPLVDLSTSNGSIKVLKM